MAQTDRIYADAPGTPFTLVERPTFLLVRLAVALLDEPLEPMRHNMDDARMLELMDDIKRNGLLQNLCVVPVLNKKRVDMGVPTFDKLEAHEAAGGRYRVAAGHRRLFACRGLNLAEVYCRVCCDLAQTEEEIMHTENMKREEVTDFDLAVMYAKWITEPGLTESALCKRAGKSPEFIYGRVKLLQGYKEVSDALHERKISFSVAQELNKVDEPEYMTLWLGMAIDGGSSTKIVRAWRLEREATKALALPAGPAPLPGVSITVTPAQKVECLCCGETQSYNLVAAFICRRDHELIREARAAQEAQEQQAAPGASN